MTALRPYVRWLSVSVLAGSIVAGVLALPSSPGLGVAGFGDVGESAYYTAPVQWMVNNDITNGTSPTCFSPGDPVTRGQAAAFMWRMEGEPDAARHSFNDVNASWQDGPISWMSATGITTGTSPTTYSPNDNLTRGQLAALMHRLAGEPPASGHPFNDITATWQQTPVAWMVANGITTGTSPSTFSPSSTVTRGQLATFFYRYKGAPQVTVSPEHPTVPSCAQQVPGPTTTTVPPSATTTTTAPPSANYPPPTGTLPYDPDRYFEVTYQYRSYLCEDPLFNFSDRYDCMRYYGGSPPLFFFNPDLYCSGPTYSLRCSTDWYPDGLDDYEFVTIGFSSYACAYQFFSGDYNCVPYYGGRPPSYYGFPTYICASDWLGNISSPCIRQ